jgi:putative spermidine/putrescine transport system substrate-binding protein
MTLFGGARAQSSGAVVVASFGGRFQDSQRKAYFEPFEKATGIKIVEATGPTVAKARAMSMSGNVEWDVGIFAPADFLVLKESNLLEKIDYNAMDKTVMSQVDRSVVDLFGIGALYYSNVIAFNTKKYPIGKHPRTWADAWDVQKFPGPRILPAATYVVRPNEFALMADGVPHDKLYPLDLDRSYKSLTRIKPNVVKWATTAVAAPQALVDGEADIAAATHGRIAQLKADGAPVDFEWNQGLITNDFWAIPKGAKNVANALKFLEFASRADTQAEFSKLYPGSPTNLAAIGLLSGEQAQQLASSPENLKKQFQLNAEWWAQKVGGKANTDRNIEMWNSWLRG